MDRAYLLSIATAAALGAVAGSAWDAVSAQAAVPRSVSETITGELGAAAQAQIEGFAQTRWCPQVDTSLGDGGTVCDAARDLRGIQFVYYTDDQGSRRIRYVATFELGGTWVAGVPQ